MTNELEKTDLPAEDTAPQPPPRPGYMETARKVVEQHHPDAAVAFVAGSVVRGEATETSDIDIVVIYDGKYKDIHRHSLHCDGWPVELFVHNRESSDHYMNSDVARGMPSMPTMIAEGIEVPVASPFSAERKNKARALLKAGPPRLSREEIDTRRYAITDLLDDLVGGTRKGEPVMMATALLYQELADFYLRAHGRWSGRGKALARALDRNYPKVSRKYEEAFIEAF